jgi:hypothetical protein
MRTIAAWFSARPALRFVIWIGVLSLLADVTYEGGRSIAGSYLAVLGATGTVVGLIAGMGELAGYGSRLLSGELISKPGCPIVVYFVSGQPAWEGKTDGVSGVDG